MKSVYRNVENSNHVSKTFESIRDEDTYNHTAKFIVKVVIGEKTIQRNFKIQMKDEIYINNWNEIYDNISNLVDEPSNDHKKYDHYVLHNGKMIGIVPENVKGFKEFFIIYNFVDKEINMNNMNTMNMRSKF